MCDESSSVKTHANREPTAVTLADLLALVVGVAVVATIPWYYWLHPFDFKGPWPRWLPYLWATRQLLAMGCLALVPVIIARRAVFGGLVRPAEFLACCGGLPQLVFESSAFWMMSTAHGIVIFTPRDEMPVSVGQEWEQGPYWTWKHQLLIVAVLATVAFLLGRRRLPGWALTVLLMIAWAGFQGTVPEQVIWGIGFWIIGIHGRPISALTGTLISHLGPTSCWVSCFMPCPPSSRCVTFGVQPLAGPGWNGRPWDPPPSFFWSRRPPKQSAPRGVPRGRVLARGGAAACPDDARRGRARLPHRPPARPGLEPLG